jgi:hypothetical protein
MQRTSLQNRSLAYTLNLLVYMQLLKDMKAKLREAAEERETLTREDGNVVDNPNHPSIFSLSTGSPGTVKSDLGHSSTTGKDLYVITKSGEIYFTTPELAKLGTGTSKKQYGQVYLGNINSYKSKK